jgi:hypothetical protein
VDPATQRAVEDYHRMLREESGVVRDLVGGLEDRMREAKLTFGGRLLCPFLRPSFVSPASYQEVRRVCRLVFQAVQTVEARLAETLWDRVDLGTEERELARLAPARGLSAPTARLDSFLTASSFQFVELNAETPAGIAYDDVLVDLFLELPLVRRFQERYTLTRFRARERLLETLLTCYREAGGTAERPTIAIVDYEDVPTRTEHHLFREFFEARGCPSVVCDPRQLAYEGGRLRHENRPVDIVYRRLLVSELLERRAELTALLTAAREGAVTVVNPFRCKALHKKSIFDVLSAEDVQGLLTAEQRAAIAAHVPWTRRVADGRAERRGQRVELPSFIRANRERLVLKPNDEYGGKGVFIGWESTEAQWDGVLDRALGASYVVQERVDVARQTFPELAGDLRFRDLIVDLDPFLFQGEVEGFLTRLSGTSLANVTSGGGQVPGFLVSPR